MTQFPSEQRVIWLVGGVSWWPPLLTPKPNGDSRLPDDEPRRTPTETRGAASLLPDSVSDLNSSSTAPRRFIGPIWLAGERVFPSAAGERSCILCFPMFHLARSLLGLIFFLFFFAFFFFFFNLAWRAKMAAARFESSAAKCCIPLGDLAGERGWGANETELDVCFPEGWRVRNEMQEAPWHLCG